jgi:1-acyl-sn-glycerol-3-phosphate acyltransferase
MQKLLGTLVLRLFRWNIEGEAPAPAKYVLIAAPHTSNWDFIFLLAFAAHFRVRVSWLGKLEMFRWPFAGLLKRLGGIPVARTASGNLVAQLAALFAEHETLALTVPAEGTRGYVDHWKSGFYHIASAANVPIVMSYLDYPRKNGGFGPAFLPTGNVARDMEAIRTFYKGKEGKRPELTGRIRLKEEDGQLEETGT